MGIPLVRSDISGAAPALPSGGQLTMFHKIAVAPLQAFHQRVATGGPIWPDFEAQTFVRHCRRGTPADTSPAPVAPVARIETPAIWGGLLDRNFGHFVSEHLPRLPFAVRARPEDLVLFIAQKGDTIDTLPGWMFDLLAWIGIDRSRIRVVTEPVEVATLRVDRQAEMLPNMRPVAGYLDLLDKIAKENGLQPAHADMVYVGRAGFAQRGMGAHLGEAYLAKRLTALGVKVIEPGAMPIRAQYEAYAGAQTLIFAEGSALHGRQGIGRIAQDVHVLRRRPNRFIAHQMLVPRVRSIAYHDVIADQLMARYPNGRARPGPAAALYDLDALFAVFSGLGLDLATGWNMDAYRTAVREDAAGWIARSTLSPDHKSDIITRLAAAGFSLASAPADPVRRD